jgi:hypothetical protein
MKNIFRLSLGLIILTVLAGIALAQDPMPNPKNFPVRTPEKEKKEAPVRKMPPDVLGMDSMKYEVPLLSDNNLAADKNGFNLELDGVKAKAFLKAEKGADTEITIIFENLNEAPKGKFLTVWIASPDKEYVKLGSLANTGEESKTSEIKGKTLLKEFGLFVTVEDGEVKEPTGKEYAAFN